MKRLLIADSSELFAVTLKEVLGAEFDIRCCVDGETALELLLNFQPDYLIINLQLPYKDGLTVLQETTYRPSIILATTSYLSPYLEQSAAALGVGYTMVTPTVNALRVRLMDMISCAKARGGCRDIQAETVTHLHILNFQTHLDGYQQLCVGIPLFYEDPNQLLTKELYPNIAQVCGGTDGRAVEHSIHKAIVSSWKKRNQTVWFKYFPAGNKGIIRCPTNKEFISCLANQL